MRVWSIRKGGSRVVALVVLLGSVLLTFAQAQDPAPATVYLIGVQHAPGQLVQVAMSSGHVRAMLAAIAPDVVGVESCPEWFAADRHYRATWEAYGIAVPWARERKLPVYGIDWIGNEGADWAERQRLQRVGIERDRLAAEVEARSYSYGACTAAQLRAAPADADCDFAVLNGEAYAQRWNDWLDGARDQKGTPQEYIGRRNGNIADLIATAGKAHPGKRIAVVIGAAHRGDLLRLLPRRGLQVGTLPAMPAGDPDDQLAAVDLVAMLTLAFDNGRGMTQEPERRTRLLARLQAMKTIGDLAVLQRYVAARCAMLAADLDAATAAFTALAATAGVVRFPFRGDEWRLYLTVAQAAQLELGRIADLRGDRAAAVRAYERVLATLPAPEYDAGYHGDFEFLARARNAVRALMATPFTAELAFATRAATTAVAAPAVRAELQQAWELHRARKWRELRAAVAAVDRTVLAELETLELDYHLAAASKELGDAEDARRRLQSLERRAAALPADHWLVRSLPALQR